MTYHDPLVLRDNQGEKRPSRLPRNTLGHRAAASVSTQTRTTRIIIEWGILFTGTREEVGWWPNPSFPFEFKEVTEGRDLACGEIFLPWRPDPARANNIALATYILPQRSPDRRQNAGHSNLWSKSCEIPPPARSGGAPAQLAIPCRHGGRCSRLTRAGRGTVGASPFIPGNWRVDPKRSPGRPDGMFREPVSRAEYCQQESIITVEHASVRLLRKPWGSHDLRPWSSLEPGAAAVGEIWFERAVTNAPDPALLLKLLFANEALSIQVHPDDAFARSIGLPHGKTEAWYILSATSNAKVAVGLKWRLTTQQLRTSIEDGSIADMVCWHHVRSGDIVFVPAGTIHAIGPGLVIAEIQQRSDATFRLFDFGRQRELHVDNAVTVAHAGPAGASDRVQASDRRQNVADRLPVFCPGAH